MTSVPTVPAPARGLRAEEAAALVLLAAIWGASFLFIKVAVDDVGPLAVVAIRLAFGALAVAALLVRRRGWAATRALVRGIRPLDALILTATASAVPFFLISWAELRIASSLAGILNAAVPLLTALVALRVDPLNRLRGRRSAGLLVGFAGVALVAGGDIGGSRAGVAAMLGAVTLYAVGAHFAKQRFAHVEPVAIALTQTALGAALTLPLALVFDRPAHVPGLDAVVSLVVLGVGGTGIAFVIYYWLLANAGPQHAVAVTYLAPIAAIGYGALVLDERVGASALAGVAIIIAGELLMAAPARGRAPAGAPEAAS